MQTPRRRIKKSMNYYMKPDYFRGNRSTFIKFWTYHVYKKLPDLNQSKGLFDSQDTENIEMGKV